MKKLIGILGVAVIAATMFFSANSVSDNTTDASLASLITMNTANAEDTEPPVKCDNGTASYYITYYDTPLGRIKGCLNGGEKCC